MLIRSAIALLPLLAWAQTPPAATPGAPPEVDKALRARVSQFFQYHVDGDFRKAYDLVAEDTKDEYFAAGKMKLKNFEIVDIKYSDNFQQAEVNTTTTMIWNIQLQSNESIVPMLTTWKIENGKWVWYHHLTTGAFLTPMGPSRIDPNLNGNQVKKIPDHFDDATISGAAAGIVKQLSLDKGMVKLSGDKPSSDKVVVHNGTPGYVRLSLAAVPEIPGFTATLDKTDVGPNQDAVVRFEYAPAGNESRAPFQIRVAADPFNQVFPVTVNLGDAPPAN
jgi:hypothetical protein